VGGDILRSLIFGIIYHHRLKCAIYIQNLFPTSQSLQDNINHRYYYLLRFKFLRWNWDCKSHLNLINRRIMYVTNIRINI